MTWTPTETVTEFADYLRVMIGGKDRTFWRAGATLENADGLAVRAQDWQSTDPYGWNNATITLPITMFEDIEAFAWLYEGARVRLDFVKDGAVIDPDDPEFYGLVDAIIPGETSTVVECSGNGNGRLSSLMHQPPIQQRDAKYAGEWLAREINGLTVHTGPVRMLPRNGLKEGPKIQARGSRDMTRLGYCDHVLGLAITEDGDSQTLLPHPTKGPKYLKHQWRPNVATAPIDFTVYAGAHGVKPDLRRDRMDMVTGVFGEGVAPNGERWRNAVYPRLIDAPTPPFPGSMSLGDTGEGVRTLARRLWALNLLSADEQQTWTFTDEVEDAVKDFQRRIKVAVTGTVNSSLWGKLYDDGITGKSFRQAHFEELAADDRTQYWLRGADGTPIDLNPDYDSSVVPNETFVSYGENVKKRHARKNARGIIKRGGDRVGTLTLTSDPAEMSRFKIRPGMVGKIKHYLGGDMRVYVSSVQVDWSGQRVTLAVSTSAKHYLELATIKQRRMEARQDPGKRWRHQLRRSSQVSDAIQGWEGESGAGIIEKQALEPGWNVLEPMVAAQLGIIGDFHLETNDPTPFYVILTADRVFRNVLENVLGDPSVWRGTDENRLTTFQTHDDWLLANERLMIESWGDPDQPCGYGNKPHMRDGKVTTHPVTGEFRDRGQWSFATKRGFLWVAVWVPSACTIQGRARIQLTEGV